MELSFDKEFHDFGRVKKGDKVSKGDLLFAYETDKAAFEQEALEDGVLLETFVDEGDDVPVLSNIGVIGAEGESTAEFLPEGSAPAPEAEAAALGIHIATHSAEGFQNLR